MLRNAQGTGFGVAKKVMEGLNILKGVRFAEQVVLIKRVLML